MNKVLVALTLSVASNIALADGFAPWDTRAVAPDTAVSTSSAVPPIGFAPWRERAPQLDVIDTETSFGGNFGSAFRPWTMMS